MSGSWLTLFHFVLPQDNVLAYRGVIKEFSVDDKGLVLVVGFGIPPHVGITPPTRACLCSLALCEELKNINIIASVGITTGPVYAGSVGSKTRREFCMVGDVVNLSARLMVNAQKTVKALREISPTGVVEPVEPSKKGFSRQNSALGPNDALGGGGGAGPLDLNKGEAEDSLSSRPAAPATPGVDQAKPTMKRRGTLSTQIAKMSNAIVEGLNKAQKGLLKIEEPKTKPPTPPPREGLTSSTSDAPATPAHESQAERLASLDALAASDSHVPQILIDERTAKEIGGCSKLCRVKLPSINVKGKVDVVGISMVFSTKVGGRESVDGMVGSARLNFARPGLAGFRYKSVTDGLFEDNSPSSPSYIARGGEEDVGGKMSLSLGDLYQDVVLSFSQFRMVLPMVLSGTAVDLPLEDMFWIRTGGVPQYVRNFADELESADRLFVDELGNLSFGNLDLSYVLEIASTVPSKVHRGISNLVARMDDQLQIVMKVVCVVGGGELDFDLLLHLMETVSPFNQFWNVLCSAEYDKQRQSEPISPMQQRRLDKETEREEREEESREGGVDVPGGGRGGAGGGQASR